MNPNVVENCLRAITKANKLKNLNMFINETFDLALKQAEQSHLRLNKKNAPKSKLDGQIATIKDNFCTESIPTTCGSKMLENYKPTYNATVVDRILNAGVVVLGKTNMDEFGMGSVSSSYFGTVKNPWNLVNNKELSTSSNDFYISGGSSGGSAATVVSKLASFSIGSDTGGSVRHPASLCGCIGFKPTYGLISRYGLIPLNNYFDTVGIMANSMQTLVDVFNTIAGPDPKDSTSFKSEFKSVELEENFSVKNLTIGIPQEFYPNGIGETNLNAWNQSLEQFDQIGNSKLISVSIPNAPYSMSCYSVLTSCEVASNLARYDGLRFGNHTKLNLEKTQSNSNDYNFESIITKTRNESFGKVVKGRIVSGNYFLLKNNYDKYFNKSHRIREMIVNDFKKVFNEQNVDLIVTPISFHDTPTYENHLKQEQIFDEKDFFTTCISIAGLPAIALPVCLSKHGLPVGIQLVARWNFDSLLLNAAKWFIDNNKSNFPHLFEEFI